MMKKLLTTMAALTLGLIISVGVDYSVQSARPNEVMAWASCPTEVGTIPQPKDYTQRVVYRNTSCRVYNTNQYNWWHRGPVRRAIAWLFSGCCRR